MKFQKHVFSLPENFSTDNQCKWKSNECGWSGSLEFLLNTVKCLQLTKHSQKHIQTFKHNRLISILFLLILVYLMAFHQKIISFNKSVWQVFVPTDSYSCSAKESKHVRVSDIKLTSMKENLFEIMNENTKVPILLFSHQNDQRNVFFIMRYILTISFIIVIVLAVLRAEVEISTARVRLFIEKPSFQLKFYVVNFKVIFFFVETAYHKHLMLS